MKRPRDSESPDIDDIRDNVLGDSGSDEGGSEQDGSDFDNSERGKLWSEVKYRLRNSLDYFPAAMSFASSGLCPVEVNPAISILGVGGIGLPLSERDGQLVSNVGHQAPFGKGSDTIVDLAVRKTTELNSDQFSLKNPAWKKTLEAVIEKVAAELGVPDGAAGVKAVLYKLLLYGKGSMFKEHRDSEKEPGMFGTLVICLPSKHEGGEVHVTHGGQKKVLMTATSSEFNYTYLCWYGDVKHEITEVTWGYRFVLTYNLIYTSQIQPVKAPMKLNTKMEELEDALLFWKNSYREKATYSPTVLAYILEHLYTEYTLSYHRLKGYDRLRGECLFELCKKHGFLIYLATMEHQVEGQCGDESNEEEWHDMYYRALNNEEPTFHYLTEVTEETLQLKYVNNLDGTRLANTVSFEESQIVQVKPFQSDPDEEDFSGPTGNEGVSAIHFYRRSVVILMPAEHRIDFLFQSCKSSIRDVDRWLDRLIEYCEQSNAGLSARRDLQKACLLITQDAGDWWAADYVTRFPRMLREENIPDFLFAKVVRIGLYLNDRRICNEGISAVLNKFPQPATVEVIERFGFTELKSILENVIRRFRFVYQRVEALNGICDGYKDLQGHDVQTLTCILEWMKSQIRDICFHQKMSCSRDAESIVKVGVTCGETYLVEQLVPALKCQISRSEKMQEAMNRTVLVFLASVYKGWKRDDVQRKTAQDVFCSVLQDFIPYFKLANQSQERRRIISSSYSLSSFLDPKNTMELLRHCIELDLGPQAHQLLDKIENLVNDPEPIIAFHGFFLPLAKEIYGMPAEKLIGAFAQEIQDKARLLSGKLLDLYADLCLGPKPTPPSDWRRARRGCGCAECLRLDAFLDDSAQENIQITVESNKVVKHLKDLLPVIKTDRYYIKDETPEYVTEVKRIGSEFELSIRKTQLAYSTAAKHWVEDKDAARKEVGRVCDDEDVRKSFEVHLKRLESASQNSE